MGQLHRLSPEGRGPFDVSGERFLVTEDDGFTKLSDARVWLGGVDITDAIARHVAYEFSMDHVSAPSMDTPYETAVPAQQSVRLTIELMLPGEFRVRGSEDEWEGPVILDQKELL